MIFVLDNTQILELFRIKLKNEDSPSTILMNLLLLLGLWQRNS